MAKPHQVPAAIASYFAHVADPRIDRKRPVQPGKGDDKGDGDGHGIKATRNRPALQLDTQPVKSR